MSKLAFLFPGQGSQAVGMGAALRESDPELYERYLGAAEQASGLDVREASLEGPIETLTRTDMAQPALFSLSLALAEVARELGLEPELVAGHSLGEYSASVASGALAFEDGVKLVSERGRLMNEIQGERPGAMAAVIGLDADAVGQLCEQASEEGLVAPANLNAPDQTVVSGEEGAVDRLVELAGEAGAKRALRLQVGAAFHSELMKPVQQKLDEQMESVDWSDASVPMASNASGEIVSGAQDVRRALVAQIASPVRWVECVHAMRAAGVTHAIEVGPGRVLGGLVRKIDPELQVTPVDSREKLEEYAAARA